MISIRRVIPKEAEVLSHIAQSAKAHWGYPKRWLEIWTPFLTFSPEYFAEHEGWTAVLDNKPIGFYTLHERNGNAWVEDLWVLPEYIGQGVGRKLFLDVVSRARQMGYKTLQLEADPNAVGFYQKMGMHIIGERHSEVDGEPRVLPIMEIDL